VISQVSKSRPGAPGTRPVVIEGIQNQQLISWQWLKTEDASKQELARV
jgi:hypothetical protein